MKKFIICLLISLPICLTCCLSCGGSKLSTPVSVPIVDVAPVPVDINPNCINSCDNIIKLKCAASNGNCGKDEICGTSDDNDCYSSCTLIQKQMEEVKASLPLACIANATSCKEVDNCK